MMNAINADLFNAKLLDAIERDMSWRPMKHMAIRWMRNHIQSPESHGWFQDVGNFAFSTTIKRGEDTVVMLDLRATLLQWIESFKQSIPWILDILKSVADFLVNNLSKILALLLVIIPKGYEFSPI